MYFQIKLNLGYYMYGSLTFKIWEAMYTTTTDSLYKTTEVGITLAVCSLFLEEHNLSIRVHWFQMGKATHIPRKEI